MWKQQVAYFAFDIILHSFLYWIHRSWLTFVASGFANISAIFWGGLDQTCSTSNFEKYFWSGKTSNCYWNCIDSRVQLAAEWINIFANGCYKRINVNFFKHKRWEICGFVLSHFIPSCKPFITHLLKQDL